MIAALAAAATLAATTGAAAPSSNPPGFLERPKADDIARFMPDYAVRKQLSGGAVLKCSVQPDSHLGNCRVAFEAPEGAGFGDAALKLAGLFRLRPPRPGAPGGGTVTIPIAFEAEGPNSPKALLISHPLWTAAPTFAEVRKADDELAAGAAGTLDLRCRVDRAGRIGLCNSSLPASPPTGTDDKTRDLFWAMRSLTERFQLVPPAGVDTGQPLMTDLRIRLPGPGDADFQARRISGQPDWLTFIDPTAAVRLFPPEAAAKGLTTGRGVAHCRVAPDGALADCHPEAGDPDGVGFSEAAVRVAAAMRMSLWTPSGGPVDGADVRIPMRFNLAPAPASSAPR